MKLFEQPNTISSGYFWRFFVPNATQMKSTVLLNICLIVLLPPSVMAADKTPAQTYMDYQHTVANTTDFEDTQLFRTEATRKKTETKFSPQSIQLMKTSFPKNVRVLKSTITGDTATIKADGTLSNAMFQPMVNGLANVLKPLGQTSVKPLPAISHATGTITMVKEDGEWKISSERWAADDPNKPAPGSPQGIASAAVGDFCEQASTMAYPNKPVHGKMSNVQFVFDNVTAEQCNLIPAKIKRVDLRFKQGSAFLDPYAMVEINKDLASLVGKTIVVSPSATNDLSIPVVFTSINSGTPTAPNLKNRSYTANDHYGMRITFSAMKGNMLPGYIVLHLPDPEHSLVEGYFYAKMSTTDFH